MNQAGDQQTLKLGDKVKHAQIHLMPDARERAYKALYEQIAAESGAIAARAKLKDFTGPHFHDIAELTVGDHVVMVLLHDQTRYVYPMHSVARVKFYITQENSNAA